MDFETEISIEERSSAGLHGVYINKCAKNTNPKLFIVMPVDNEEHSITNVGIEVYDKLRKNPERIDMKNTIARYLYITPLPNTENKIGTNTDLVIYRKKDESDH